MKRVATLLAIVAIVATIAIGCQLASSVVSTVQTRTVATR
jgi:hypothetical protein